MDEKRDDYLVNGTTKSGISFTLDTRVREDSRFLHYLVKMRDKSDRLKQAEYMYKLLDMMFGGDEGVMVFEDEIARRHNGVCTEKELITELQDIFEALKIKNSSSSPT